MKTKHLFLATALMASFAACTNEEIVSDVQQNVAAGRPTVDNVVLDFGMNANSRVSYDDGYKWNSTDVIGALLMDQPKALPSSEEWAEKAWYDKYDLTSTIHTSYPFAYADGKWSCNTKMLEGNYFFAWPWESYNGNRQVLHSLIDQKQTGVEKDVRPVSYAENQFFIGYQRIMAGTEAQDVLNKVEMWPVLGGIQLQIVNTGTQTYHINKVVLSSAQLNSTLTFNPVYSAEGGYNYSELKGEDFNFANYLELEDEKGYNKKATEDYSREEALLAVVAPVANENADGFVQLLIEGEEDERALEAEAGNTAYVMIMANPVAKVTDLKLAIYTDEGIVSNIDLTKINKEIDAEKGASAITSAKVKAIGPNVTNTIKVQIDDNSFYTPTEINVYNDNDLLQFIQWNVAEVGAREIVATIEKDVTFTEEMYDLLTSNKNITLGLVSKTNTMTLEAEFPTDFLDNEQLVFAAEFKNKETDASKEPDYDFDGDFAKIEILGDIVLSGDASEDIESIVVAKNASLTIDSKKVKNVKVENNGELTIGGNTKHLTSSSTIVNNNVMIVQTDAVVAAKITNNADLELEDEAEAKKVENAAEGEIALGEDSKLNLTSNAGLVITEEGAVVTGDNTDGRIEYVTGAKVGDIGGIIYQKVEGAKTSEPTGAAATNVNTWYVVDDITIAADATITNVEVMGDHDILVDVPTTGSVKLTISGYLKINGSTTTEGVIDAGSIVVEENGVWTNDGTVTITTKNGLSNKKGEIENNGVVNIATGSTAYNPTTEVGYITGEWDGNEINVNAAADTSLQDAYNTAVERWWNTVTKYTTYVGDEADDFYNYNPKDVERFAALMIDWYKNDQENNNGAAVNALFKKFGYITETDGVVTESTAWSALDDENRMKTLIAEIEGDAEFTTAVANKVLTMNATDLASLKDEFIAKNGANLNHLYNSTKGNLVSRNEATVFESEDDAMIDLYKKFAKPATVNTENLKKYVNIWQFTSDIKSAFANSVFTESSKEYKAKYAYVWTGSDLDNVVKVMASATLDYWKSVGYAADSATNETFYTMEGLVDFLKNAEMIGKTEGAAGKATTAAGTYLEAAEEWGYSDTQVKIIAKNSYKVSLTMNTAE